MGRHIIAVSVWIFIAGANEAVTQNKLRDRGKAGGRYGGVPQ